MKAYVAGKFERKDEVHKIYDKLEEIGINVAYDWTKHNGVKPYKDNQEQCRTYSENEINGIIDSDIFIFLSNPERAGTTLMMELGAAIALSKSRGKPKVYAIGECTDTSPWFFNENVTRANVLEDIIESLVLLVLVENNK